MRITQRKTLAKNIQQELERRKSGGVFKQASAQRSSNFSNVFKKVVLNLVFWIVIAIAIYFLLFSPYLMIKNVILVGAKNLTEDEVEKGLKDIKGGRFLLIFPCSNLIIFPKAKAEKILVHKFPQIAEINISKRFPSILKISILEREPVAIWQREDARFYLDINGNLGENIIGEPQFNLPKIRDLSASKIASNGKIVSQRFVEYLQKLNDEFESRTSVKPAEFLTPSSISNEIHIKTEEGWTAYFSIELDVEGQLNKLMTVLNKEIGENAEKKLEYVDLRIKDKVFYK